MKEEVEALLFSSPEPIDVREIAKILRARVEDVEKAVNELIKDYEGRSTALEIVKLGNKVLMRVKPKYQHLVSGERDLDKSTLRTLAIIAANQPIELSKLAKMRGNRCYEHVKKLEELGLVKSERKGRTKVLTTTEAFVKYFGLNVSSVEEIKDVLRKRLESLNL
ncbi:SMC-Scp complex subunit ScpB [Archaeoglobus sp.]